MNTKTFLPLTAAALFAVCAGSMLLAGKTHSAASVVAQPAAELRIVDLPAVNVRPAAEDLAIYQASRIVDLAAITVRPAAEDLAIYQASRIVDLAAVTVRPSAEDVQMVAVGAAVMAQQLAAR